MSKGLVGLVRVAISQVQLVRRLLTLRCGTHCRRSSSMETSGCALLRVGQAEMDRAA